MRVIRKDLLNHDLTLRPIRQAPEVRIRIGDRHSYLFHYEKYSEDDDNDSDDETRTPHRCHVTLPCSRSSMITF